MLHLKPQFMSCEKIVAQEVSRELQTCLSGKSNKTMHSPKTLKSIFLIKLPAVKTTL